MKKSIILEGPNGSGKSTLGDMLSKILSLEYIHAGPDPGPDLAAFRACYDQYQHLVKGCILDRCTPISKFVYDRYDIGSDEVIFLAHWMQMMDEQAYLIYCTGEGFFEEKSYYPPGHMETITEDRLEIREHYDGIMSVTPHITYNFETDSIDDLLEAMRK